MIPPDKSGLPLELKTVEHKAVIESSAQALHHKTVSQFRSHEGKYDGCKIRKLKDILNNI
jgi:hypothetical protein